MTTAQMSLPSLPSTREALLSLRNNGFRRSIGKAVTGCIAGRQRWYRPSSVVPDTTRPGLPGSILDVEPPLPDEPIA